MPTGDVNTPDDAASKAAEKAIREEKPAVEVQQEAEKAAAKAADDKGVPLTSDQIKAIGVASADAAVERWKALGVFDPVDQPAVPPSAPAPDDKKDDNAAEPVKDREPKKKSAAGKFFGLKDE